MFLILFVFLQGCSAYHITANTLIVADWGQTRHIARSPYFQETNPILGPNPSTGDVDKYFTSALVVYNTAYYLTPEKNRDKVAAFVSIFQLGYVYNNYTLGVKFDF